MNGAPNGLHGLNQFNQARRRFLQQAAVAVAMGRLPMLNPVFETTDLSVGGELDSLSRASGWLNSPALGAAELGGKVVLVQFWTFTCINWLRTMPYIRAWSDKYRESGLITIGAHTPEFPFERTTENVRRAARELNVIYPVAMDNEYAIWGAFRNRYWPALYLLDGKGRVRHRHFGEGVYDDFERMIQKVLNDTGARPVDRQLVSVDGRGIEAAPDWSNLKTPETYVGYERGENFASPGGAAADRSRLYALPRELRSNQWALAGDWTIRQGAITLNQSPGQIAFRFHGRDLHLVMGPPSGKSAVRFRVSLDGQPPSAARGLDVDEQGMGVAKDQRLYQLIRQPQPIVDRVFQIEFLDREVEAFSFTFG
jgi:thiol-disulfide isomerase/thioredoxin